MRKADGFESERILVLSRYLQEEFAKDPLAQKLYATDIGYYSDAKYHYRERPLGCEEYILIFCVNGEGWIDNGGSQQRVIKKYDLLVLPPHLAHTYGASTDQPWSIHWVHFKGELAEHYFNMLPLSDFTLRISNIDALRITALFESCFTILSEKSYSLPHSIYANLLLQQLLGVVSIQTQHSSDQTSKDYVERSIEYMRQHIAQNISLNQLAKQVNLSRSHYLAVFKHITGYSPMQYFLQLKIRQACTYIDLTEWTIKKIGGKVGFQDPLYFSRVFRKVMGISPTHYRQRQKG